MKPFLGIDVTENKKNERINGDEFITASVSSTMSEALEKSTDEALEIEDKASMPLAFNIVRWVCSLAGLAIGAGILKADVGFEEGYANAPALYWICGACLLIAAVMSIIAKVTQKKVLESDDTQNVEKHLDSLTDMISEDLGIPKDAREVDVLHFRYKIKDGGIAVRSQGMEFTPYYNLIFSAYVTDSTLNLTNLEHRYSIPLSSMRKITRVKKRISVPEWNKDSDPKNGEYKQYKLTVDNYGCVHMKEYFILECEYYGEVWGIYFPCYELPVFEQLTGMKAE